MERILLPQRIGGTYSGFCHLVDLQNKVEHSPAAKILLDGTYLGFCGANLCAVLAGIIHRARSLGKEVLFENLQGKVLEIWNRNYFWLQDQNNVPMDFNNTVVHYMVFDVKHGSDFGNYIRTELLSKRDLPKMSEGARKAIQESLYEIYSNAVLHSGCDQVFTCGQYYPSKHVLEFTMVDMGRTFRTNVSEFWNQPVSGAAAIDWAVKDGSTTKVGNTPGGLGLFRIRSFLLMNKGKLQIVSADGFWQEMGGNSYSWHAGGEFPGTIVNLTFNMKDDLGYRLKSEPEDVQLF